MFGRRKGYLGLASTSLRLTDFCECSVGGLSSQMGSPCPPVRLASPIRKYN
jgi:hypothetical protein